MNELPNDIVHCKEYYNSIDDIIILNNGIEYHQMV